MIMFALISECDSGGEGKGGKKGGRPGGGGAGRGGASRTDAGGHGRTRTVFA